MPPIRYRGPPMTLANMRAQGVRSLWVVCEFCRHDAVINVDGYGEPCRSLRSARAWCALAAASLAHSRGPIGRSARCRRA
jgi:hypothetical protein